jgi:crotonobetainyl-CoA:carnitine CoA-transferase CaiB-like acyl-CoA transferase
VITRGPRRERRPDERPLVLDLTAVWAGPLAGHLLWLAGAQVVKVESRTRPDVSRDSDPALFVQMHQGKDSVVVDLARPEDRAALVALIRRADVVIESSRPRGLQHLGIDADALVRECPGLVWMNLTGYGASGEPANWTGFGHDSGVCGGLTTALEQATGQVGYLGDALPDPLTGITAATAAWHALAEGEARRIGVALSGVAALALQEEREHDAAALDAELRDWAAAKGQLLPDTGLRPLLAELRPLGADNEAWLGIPAPC